MAAFKISAEDRPFHHGYFFQTMLNTARKRMRPRVPIESLAQQINLGEEEYVENFRRPVFLNRDQQVVIDHHECLVEFF